VRKGVGMRKSEYPKKTTDLPQVTDKLYLINSNLQSNLPKKSSVSKGHILLVLK